MLKFPAVCEEECNSRANVEGEGRPYGPGRTAVAALIGAYRSIRGPGFPLVDWRTVAGSKIR
jgi:hypothetical protein